MLLMLVSVYEMGWCEFDPTNNIISGERHITAYGRDYLIFPHQRNYF
jgi:transglutaminase-like putative cysteine protease